MNRQLLKICLDDPQLLVLVYVDWGSRFVGDMNWCSVVGTGLSGPTLRYCKILPVQQGKTQSMAFNSISGA
jgi:hypothetical protein